VRNPLEPERVASPEADGIIPRLLLRAFLPDTFRFGRVKVELETIFAV
jgi:hypothetical protein